MWQQKAFLRDILKQKETVELPIQKRYAMASSGDDHNKIKLLTQKIHKDIINNIEKLNTNSGENTV